jgi:hypothetical protein
MTSRATPFPPPVVWSADFTGAGAGCSDAAIAFAAAIALHQGNWLINERKSGRDAQNEASGGGGAHA